MCGCPLQLGEHSANHFKVLLRSLRLKGEGVGLEPKGEGVGGVGHQGVWLEPKGEGMGGVGHQGVGLEDIINSSLEAVKKCGFINYFGLQRLGSRLSGPRIGLALLQDNPVCSGWQWVWFMVSTVFCLFSVKRWS